MPYEQIHAYPKGYILFRTEHAEAKYCVKCKSSRFLEVDSGHGQKRHLTIPVKILWYLPFIPRIQWLYMTEESAKQMTWHKYGCRYNPEKLVHPSDGEAWTRFDMIHCEKALEAHNVCVALWQQIGSILMEWRLPHTLVGPCLLSLSISALASSFNDRTYSYR